MKIVILAGGRGTRLWPLSRETFPKQFLKIGDKSSLLQRTVHRFLRGRTPDDLLVVTNPAYHNLVKNQLLEIHPLLERRIVVEPAQRNTGPAILYALKYLLTVEGVSLDDTFLITPSDQMVDPETAFEEYISQAEAVAQRPFLVTLGVVPHRPETGYGYLQVEEEPSSNIYRVTAFVEKPPLEKAQQYLASGQFLWNSGVVVFTGRTFFEQVSQYSPELKPLAVQSYEELTAAFVNAPTLSIDYALMERSPSIVAIPLLLTWTDLGSWDHVFEMLEKDTHQNAIVGNVHARETKNSLIYGGKRLISTVGLEDLIIVETDDAVFIGKKGESQKVKEIVEELKKRQAKELHEPLTMARPWGEYTVLETGGRFKVKRILVHPGHRLSLQLHHHRSEHWIVVTGTAKVTLDGVEKWLHENESLYVPKSTRHRLENPGKVILEIIEVQVGEYTEEDDIVRFEDRYGRE